MRYKCTFALLLVFSVLVFSHGGTYAISEPAQPISVLAVDENASYNSLSWDMAKTATAIWTTSLKDQKAAFVLFGKAGKSTLQQVRLGNAYALAMHSVNSVDIAKINNTSDTLGALAETYNYFFENSAPQGSSVLLLVSRQPLGDISSNDFTDLSEAFAEKGWIVNVAYLPNADILSKDKITNFAINSGGIIVDLATREGRSALLKAYISDIAGTPIMDLNISANSVAKSINVLPHTECVCLYLYRIKPETSVKFYQPDGSLVDHNLGQLKFVEAPNIVITQFNEPKPGKWVVVVEGGDQVTLFRSVPTALDIKLVNAYRNFEVGREYTITASSSINQRVVSIDNAWIEAKIVRGEVIENVYQLLDNGLNSDDKKGDGIFTAPSPYIPSEEGAVEVNLTLHLEENYETVQYVHSITTKPLPQLSILSVNESNIEMSPSQEGSFMVVAEVLLQGKPYAIPINSVKAHLMLPDSDNTQSLNAIPYQPQAGKTHQFTIEGSKDSDSVTSLVVEISNLPDFESQVSQTYQIEPFTQPADFNIAQQLNTDNSTFYTDYYRWLEWFSTLPNWVYFTSAVALLGVITFIISFKVLRKTAPFGYLYDDLDNQVVDFASLKRGFLEGIFRRNIVKVEYLPQLPLTNGIFKFNKRRVEFHYANSASAVVRVNGKPAKDIILLSPEVTLGISGRLLTFYPEN